LLTIKSIVNIVHLNHVNGFQCTKVLCPQNLFSRKSQIYKGHTSYYIDIWHLCFWHTMCYDYYWQNHNILQWSKQKNTSVELLAMLGLSPGIKMSIV